MYYGGICQDSCEFDKLTYQSPVTEQERSSFLVPFFAVSSEHLSVWDVLCNWRMESETVVEIDGETAC